MLIWQQLYTESWSHWSE